jgi:hypothetical protein
MVRLIDKGSMIWMLSVPVGQGFRQAKKAKKAGCHVIVGDKCLASQSSWLMRLENVASRVRRQPQIPRKMRRILGSTRSESSLPQVWHAQLGDDGGS